MLITRLVAGKLNSLDTEVFHIAETFMDKQEASRYHSLYLAETIRFVLNEVRDKDRPLRQIELSNKIITVVASEFENLGLSGLLSSRRA